MDPEQVMASRPADAVITLDGIPPSKKNGQQIMKRGRRRFVTSSDAAKAFECHLQLVARRMRSLGANYFATRITIDEGTKRTRVEVWDLGPQPTRGRCDTLRDVHNCADVVMDAMQKVIYDDDRQARAVTCRYGTVE